MNGYDYMKSRFQTNLARNKKALVDITGGNNNPTIANKSTSFFIFFVFPKISGIFRENKKMGEKSVTSTII